MFALGIENSNPSAACQAGAAPATIAIAEISASAIRLVHREVINTSNPYHDDLLSAIERAVAASGIPLSRLGSVAVSAGPGGYTAVRIGVTAAKFIAESTGAACVAVPTALAVAHALAPRPEARLGVALASKGETAWVTVVDQAAIAEGKLMDAHDLAATHLKVLVADQFLPTAFKEAAAALNMQVVPPRFDALSVIDVGRSIPPVDPVHLSPIYPREPEAVIKWRELALKKSRG